jgi:hypothetical protein
VGPTSGTSAWWAPFSGVGGEASPATSRWLALGWLVPLAVQVVHTFAVAPAYRVGSFDDDANYLMAAHVLASGGWLTSKMPSGATVVAYYLPGYPMLLVPLVWLWGSALWPPRVFSTVCVGLLYPLLWAWMGRRGLKPCYRVAVLGLLAINTVLATYSTMVMAEAPFLLVLVLALFALDRWERRPGVLNACVVVVLMAGLVWLKEAGIGLVAGLVLYELWRRRWSRAAGVSLGTAALLLPALVARWASGGSTIGNRYVGEISPPGQGGFLHQLPKEVVQDTWSYLQNVLRQSVLPTGSPLPSHGPVELLMAAVGATVPVFGIVGAVSWYRRHPRAESWMLWAYFLETLAYPYTNQRRVILVLPVVTIWYVTGAAVVWRWALDLGGQTLSKMAASVAVVVAVLAAGVPTAAGFTRDYLYNVGQKSSEFAHSPAMALLKAIGPPSAVVETDYRGSVAYFSGHRTAWTAFTATTPYGPFAAQNRGSCTVPIVRSALQADDAEFLMVGDVNIPGLTDSPCLLQMASTASTGKAVGAVRLISTDHDQTSVFELVGPSSSQPGVTDWTADAGPSTPAARVALQRNGNGDAGGTGYTTPSSDGMARFAWSWGTPVAVTQVSVGSVTSTSAVQAVNVSVESAAGVWQDVVAAPGAVGDGGAAPYLLAELPASTEVLGVDVSVRTSGTAEVAYVNAIGRDSG